MFPRLIKPLSKLLLCSLLLQLSPLPAAQAANVQLVPGGTLPELREFNSIETQYGLVAILVEESIWEAESTGENFEFFGGGLLRELIERYAEDVQSSLPYTKSLILTVADDESPVDIQRSLERFYLEGNPDDEDPTQLIGTVLIGDVPLPVLNREGSRQVSVLPYTDFLDPAYVVDPETEDFVANPRSSSTEAEIWHGLMVPPLEGQPGIELLAAYFEKNHAYHEGDEEFADFDSELLIADFLSEASAVNEVAYGGYERFLGIWEELTYAHYTNDLAEALYLDMMGPLEDASSAFLNVDNDGDGLVDEDGSFDNNNDADWVTVLFQEGDADFFRDNRVDEDPPGDANGDGCPGVCGEDDNGAAYDHDGDGYPTGWEILFGYDWTDERRPIRSVAKKTNATYGTSFTSDEAATAYLENFFIDDMYSAFYKHPSCIDSNGVFHGEWDDDEDGFCDEDGSNEIPAGSVCAYNDADCDGLIDEDPTGELPETGFEDLPDIQSREFIHNMTPRYSELFEQPLGVWNRMVEGSGRYGLEDYESSVSLIAKRDEYVLQYLADVNAFFEEQLDSLVEDELQEPVPVVALMRLTGTYTIEETTEEGESIETDYAICEPGRDPDLSSSNQAPCLQFVNHSTSRSNLNYEQLYADRHTNDVYIYGQHLWEVDSVAKCSLFAGTEEEGQFVQYNPLYSSVSAGLSQGEIQNYKNCTPENAPYVDDIEGLCAPVLATESVRSLEGAREFEFPSGSAFEEVEVGAGACFEFRELSTYDAYSDELGNYNDWLTGRLRRFRNSGEDDPESYEAFLDDIAETQANRWPNALSATLRKNFNELDVIASDPSLTYTVYDLVEDWRGASLEDENLSNDDIDLLLALQEDGDAIRIQNPSGLNNVSELEVNVEKIYLKEGSLNNRGSNADLTDNRSEAEVLSSLYKHTEPYNETLNAQVQSLSSPNLPIDEVRRVSFLDGEGNAQTLNYVNAFDAQTAEDLEAQVQALAIALVEVEGGSRYATDVTDWFDELNLDQLEDALAWQQMGIDEKHDYLFTHYLGDELALVAEPSRGYEAVQIIAEGSAQRIEFAFNGTSDEDAELEALITPQVDSEVDSYEPLSTLSNTTPVPIQDWFPAVEEWLVQTQETVTTLGRYGGGNFCGLDPNSLSSNVDSTLSQIADEALSIDDILSDSELIEGAVTERNQPLTLQMVLGAPFLIVGSEGSAAVTVVVQGENGNRALDFNGVVELELEDPRTGRVDRPTLALTQGLGTVQVFAGTKAGEARLVAYGDGMNSDTLSFDVKAGDPYALRVQPEDGQEKLDSGTDESIVVEVLDEYGNLVDNDSSTVVNLRLTEISSEFGNLDAASSRVNQGLARFTLNTGELSGPVNLVAESSGLELGAWEGRVVSTLEGSDFEQIAPQMLYGSLLGAPYGDVTQEDYIGGWLTFNGKTQAVSTWLSDPEPSPSLLSIDAKGHIQFGDGALVLEEVQAASGAYPTRVQWRRAEDGELIGELIYSLTSTDDLDVTLLDDELELQDQVVYMGSSPLARVTDAGQIQVLDPNYRLQVNREAAGLSFHLVRGFEAIVRFDLPDFEQDVNALSVRADLSQALAAGLYLLPGSDYEYALEPLASGNSSALPMGYRVQSLEADRESSLDEAVGWELDDKHLLLFSAGNSVGESNRFFSDESTVVLGDPTVSLAPSPSNDLGFNNELGTLISTSDEEILELADIDVNGDGHMDLIVAYDDGRIKWQQNLPSAQRFWPRGDLLHIETGLLDIDAGDVDGDGLEDLLVVTEQECIDGDSCLYLFRNIGGGFVPEALNFEDFASRAKSVQAYDLNNDDYAELIVVDRDLNLYIVWNLDGEWGQIDLLESFGLSLDPLEDLSSSLDLEGSSIDNLIVRKNWAEPDTELIQDGQRLDLEISIENVGTATAEFSLSDSVSTRFQFLQDSFECTGCSGSELEVRTGSQPWGYDNLVLNSGGRIEISYGVQVRSMPNVEVMVSENLIEELSDDDYADLAVSMEGNQSGELIVFVSSDTETLPEGASFVSARYERVLYEQQTLSPEAEAATELENPFDDSDGDGIPDFMAGLDPERGIPVDTAGIAAEIFGAEDLDGDGYYSPEELFNQEDDADGDGLFDTLDLWSRDGSTFIDPEFNLQGDDLELGLSGQLDVLNGNLSQVTGAIESAISAFTCDGGCLALPGSIAFLAPGPFHDPFTGATIGQDPGFPIFGITGSLPFVCAGPSCFATSVMRVYMAPTSTLGVGLAVCAGPYGPTGQCFSVSLPVFQSLGVCDLINQFLSETLSQASSFVSLDGSKIFQVQGSLGTSQLSSNPSGLESDLFGSYEPPVATEQNIQVPGFPATFTEWWKAQKYQFFKMLDLPDITFIYPDPRQLSSSENQVDLVSGQIEGLEDFLNKVHSIPMVDIKTQPVYIHVPDLRPENIDIAEWNWTRWLDQTTADFEQFKADFLSREQISSEERAIYNELVGTMDALIANMEANLDALASYRDLPRDILMLREATSLYAQVIVCYLDVVLNTAGGYLNENAQRIQAWTTWISQLRGIISSWDALIDVSVDLMESCDKCTNQRYSTMQLLFNLFVFVPDFPVIELPRLPDITIDASQIQAGIEILWPDLRFIPEPVVLPDPPLIQFPSIYLEGSLDLDVTLPVLPEFNIDFNIPELPGLPIPELPTLPPPPALPQLDPSIEASLDITSDIIRIVCLLRQGFIPVNEMLLKTKIEDQTQRPAGVVLPSDLAIQAEWGSFNYEFAREIIVESRLTLTPEFGVLFDAISNIADESQNLIYGFNEAWNLKSNEIQNGLDAIFTPIGNIEEGIEVDVDIDVDATLDEGAYITDPAAYIASGLVEHPLAAGHLSALQSSLHDLQAEIDAWAEQVPADIVLEVDTVWLAQDDAQLHRFDELSALEADFLDQIEGSGLESVARLRDELLKQSTTFTQNTERGLAYYESGNMLGFYESILDHSERALAQNLGSSSSHDESWSLSEAWTPSELEDLDDGLDLRLASTPDPEAIGSNQASLFDDGLYIYNEDAGLGARLIAYSQENDLEAHLLFVDLDQDDDDDIVYSLGRNVYLKRNTLNEPTERYVVSNPVQAELADFVPSRGALRSVQSGRNDHQMASFSFEADPNAVAYEVLFYDSLDVVQSDPGQNIDHLLLVTEEALPETPIPAPEDFDSTLLPATRPSKVRLTDFNGRLTLLNAYERQLLRENRTLQLESAVTLQALEDSRLQLQSTVGELDFEVSAGDFVDIPSYQEAEIFVREGEFMLIDRGERVPEQDLEEGMALLPDELLRLDGRLTNATIEDYTGNQIELDHEVYFLVREYGSSSNVSVQIEIPNGAYYTRARALYEDGETGTFSPTFLLNPQICADQSAPYAIVSQREVDLALFSQMELSAAASFDDQTELSSITWDLDALEDSDGDGIATNDVDASGETALIGPYETLEPRTVTLTVTDLVGNSSQATVAVNLYVPDLRIDRLKQNSSSESFTAEGSTNPESPDFPFTLVRERNEAITALGDHRTDERGDWEAELQDSELMNVFNSRGTLVAQYKPSTHQAIALVEGYRIEALSSGQAGEWPTRLAVVEEDGERILGSFLVVADSRLDLELSDAPLDENPEALLNQESVLVHLLDEDRLDAYAPSAWSIVSARGQTEVTVTNEGDIGFYDPRYRIERAPASSLDEPLILEIYDEDELIAQVWPGNPEHFELTTTEPLGLEASSTITGRTPEVEKPFSDLPQSDPLYEDVDQLVDYGILEGYNNNGVPEFRPNQQITRAEFTKIILGLLCIVPRQGAYELPPVFNDILSTDQWYFPYTKESQIRDLITGYLGETDALGLAPFKPNQSISRAEATKIILEALDQEGIIELPENLMGEPWYSPYIAIGRDLSPYLVYDNSGGSTRFILTDEEARDPNKLITRYEFVQMSTRVLQAYNCYETPSGLVDLDLEPGIYAVQEPCNTCPCLGSIDYAADLISGDTLFGVIQNEAGEIFGMSNRVQLE